MSTAPFDRIATIYDATRSLPLEEMQYILRAMSSELKGCKTILDAGVGTGRFAVPLSELGFSIVGVDISMKMMKLAQQKGMRDLIDADAAKLCFKDGVFDASLVVHVLHQLKDWKPVVHELARVSRYYVVSVVGRTQADKSPRRQYIKFRREFGYPLDRFEEGEEGLREQIRPNKIIKVWQAVEETNANDAIDHLRKKQSSVTWDIPEQVHDKIIQSLTDQFGNTMIKRISVTELAIWEAETLLGV
jgi:ubiquinone/menaquinone biosynthesis C-methylase UbiE